MPTAREFYDALVAVRDTQVSRTVGSISLSPDNRIGRGFRAEQQILRYDPLGLEPSRLCPSSSGMRNWPHTDAGMMRVARDCALRDAAEQVNRASDVHKQTAST